MKKTFIFIAFVVLVASLSAQPKIHSSTHFSSLHNNLRIENFYYYSDSTEIVESWRHTQPDSIPALVSRHTLRFDVQKHLLSDETINFGTSLRTKTNNFAKILYENTYNQNGCRMRWQYSYTYQDTVYERRTIESKVNEKCQILEDRLIGNTWDNRTRQLIPALRATKIYAYDVKDSLQSIRLVYGADSGYIKILKRQVDGKKTEVEAFNVCEFCFDVYPTHTKTQISYDNQGQVVSEITVENKNTLKNPIWYPWDSTIYTYTNNRLAQDKSFSVFQTTKKDYIRETVYNYDYDLYCDGLVKQAQKLSVFRIESSELNIRELILYKYTEGSTCYTTATNTVKLFPNPANWRTTIETEDLFSADFNLLIYNDLGQEVAHYTIDYRTPSFDFSTQNLPNGAYILRLVNGEKSISKKMVIAH